MGIVRKTVPAQDEGRTLLHFLRGALHIGNHLLAAAKARNAICVDGIPRHTDYVLHAGETVSVCAELPTEKRVTAEEGPFGIVWEDEYFLVIDKPAPLACQCTERNPLGTLENRLAAHYGEDFVFRPLNRLDKGTSGLLAAAKDAHGTACLQKLLHSGAFEREYLAVVCGNPGSGIAAFPIAREGEGVRRTVSESGKPCVTEYRTLRSGNGMSLVRLRLQTGRTHQIRVHMSALGCPLAGDFLYGREDSRLPGRFALHSAYLSFEHPFTGKTMTFESALPRELEALLETQG